MLVDGSGEFLTQRKHHQMALIQAGISGGNLTVHDKKNPTDGLQIPLDLQTDKQMEVGIWDDRVKAVTVAPDMDKWFSEKLGLPCHLVKMPDTTQRKVNPKYAVNGESVSFADGMPYLIIGQESLDHLNSKLEIPVSMDRFRPNVVFSGGAPFIEDELKDLVIGGVKFRIVKPCARCVLTTVDQTTGEKGKEPLKTLAAYRTIDKKVMFGQNMVALEEGVIKAGDLLDVS